jgi:hypothetical protein
MDSDASSAARRRAFVKQLGAGLAGAGAGAAAMFAARADAQTAHGGALFKADSARAQPRSIEDKLRDTVSILDFIPESEHAAIFAGTSRYDCLPAFQAALALERPRGSQSAAFGAAGPAIHVPCGTYHVGGTIELKRRVHIHGDGSAMANSSEASRIVFPAGVHGFIVHAYNTIGDRVQSSPTTQGSGSILYGLMIEGTPGGAPAHGVWLRGMATIEQCRLQHWSGDGVHIVAGARARAAEETGNANGWALRNVRIVACDGDALHVQGADSNAGVGLQVQCSSIGRWGIYDNSFLGNTYVGCMTEVCGKLSQVSHKGMRYYCADAQRAGSTEPGSDNKVWVPIGPGGVNAASFPAWRSGGAYAIGGSYASLNPNARNVFVGCYSENSQPPSKIIAPALVFGGLFGAVTPDSTAGIFTSTTHGPVIEGALQVPNLQSSGARIGSGGNTRMHAVAEAPPAKGTFVRGDYVRNAMPAPGEPKGWFCVESGTPGKWVSEGNL